MELKLGCLSGKGKRIPKGQAQKFVTIAFRLRAPGSQPSASTSITPDVAIEDLDGHSSRCTSEASPAASPFYTVLTLAPGDTMPESHVSHFRTWNLGARTCFTTPETAEAGD